MQSGGKAINNLTVYSCGHCLNNFHRVFHGVPNQKQKIPATAVVFQHTGDYYLFDTGYSQRVFENGWRSKVYRKLNPVVVEENESLAVQLAKDGVNINKIKGIILSHLHPDHIGGLADFPKCAIFLSRDAYATFQKPSLRDLVFTNLLPADFEKRAVVLDIKNDYDLFGDQSVILKDIPGHAKGQMGMFLPEHNIFFAADASWGTALLDKPMKLPGRLLQKDYISYRKTADALIDMQKNGVRIRFTHEVQQ